MNPRPAEIEQAARVLCDGAHASAVVIDDAGSLAATYRRAIANHPESTEAMTDAFLSLMLAIEDEAEQAKALLQAVLPVATYANVSDEYRPAWERIIAAAEAVIA